MKSFKQILEEKEQTHKPVVMAFGRMNPPTTGHLKVIDKVKSEAEKRNAKHVVFTSHSQDSKKNPLSSTQKIKHLKRYAPDINFKASTKEHPTFLHQAAKLHQAGHDHLIYVAGSDRVKEMHDKLHQYNGTHPGALYNFKKIDVVSAGHRDPDAEGTEGMSGTKMRKHAENSDFSSFRQGVPGHVADHHARELMRDVRKGMGLHEDVNRGMFKAIFITGGPGSGKDIVIREAIAESKVVELNLIQAYDYLRDKHKLHEKTNDVRKESIRNRCPLIINGPADDREEMLYVKEELEELGYETIMVFVNTTNEVSQQRNGRLTKMVSESVRIDKWNKAQENRQEYSNIFKNFICFDNNLGLEQIEENITETYQKINDFISIKNYNDIAFDWLENHGRLNINESINFLFKEDDNVKKTSKFSIRKAGGAKASGTGDIPADNRAGDPNADNIKWGANNRRGSYIFRTYVEAKETTITKRPEPKERNFSKDKEKVKKRYKDAPTVSQRMRNVATVGPEFDTRQQGTVYPMSGLGDVTYREQREFKNFRNKLKEAIDDPGAVDMGVGGVLNGATNKEPMQSYKDSDRNTTTSIKRKKKK